VARYSDTNAGSNQADSVLGRSRWGRVAAKVSISETTQASWRDRLTLRAAQAASRQCRRVKRERGAIVIMHR
jgi:hypothetical protein